MNPAPIDEVVDLLRTLRLPHMRAAAPELLATAKAQRWEPAEAMRALHTEELAGRQASSIRARRKAAGFPTGKNHFLEALGQAAVDAGHKVSWFSLEHLGALVRRHSADDTAGDSIRLTQATAGKGVTSLTN